MHLIDYSILLLEKQLPELLLCIITFVPDKSDDLGDTSLRKSYSPVIRFLVERAYDLPLEKYGKTLKLQDSERIAPSEKIHDLLVEMISEFPHVSHERPEIFPIFGIDAFEPGENIEA